MIRPNRQRLLFAFFWIGFSLGLTTFRFKTRTNQVRRYHGEICSC